MITRGRLLGIARHALPKAPMEVIESAEVTRERGVEGDYRGAVRGGPHPRQVTLFERADWETALALVGFTIPWQERRVNLLVDLDLPQAPGALVQIGGLMLEITVECDPCVRMDALAPGLKAALLPDWRGGVCAKVVADGRIAVGDEIRIEEPWPNLFERSTTSGTSAASASSSGKT